jgi:hypothetical protein
VRHGDETVITTRSSDPQMVAREGALDNPSPALCAGKTGAREFRGREGGHHKVLVPREIL